MEIFFAILTVLVGVSALISPVIVFILLEKKEERGKMRSFETKRKLVFDDTLQQIFKTYESDKLTLEELEGLPDILVPRIFKRISNVDLLIRMRAEYAKKQCDSDEEFAKVFSDRYRIEYEGELGDSLAVFVLSYIKIIAALQKQCEYIESRTSSAGIGENSFAQWLFSESGADFEDKAKMYDRIDYKNAVINLSDAYRRVQMAFFDLDAVRCLGRFAKRTMMDQMSSF